MKQIQYSTGTDNGYLRSRYCIFSNFAFLKQLNFNELPYQGRHEMVLGGEVPIMGSANNLDFCLEVNDETILLKVFERFPERVKIPYSEDEAIVLRKRVIADAYLSLNIETCEIEVGDKFFDCELQSEVAASNEACEFILSVLEHKNLYLYKKMTTTTPTTKKLWNGLSNPNQFLAYNMLRNLNNLEKIESMFKTFGDKFVFQNIVKAEFEINGDKKKLNQVIDLPINVATDLKSIGQENCFNEIKNLAALDKNYASLMTSYAVSLNRLLGQRPLCGFENFEKFISNCTKIISEFDIPLKTLLDYLIREKALYCTTYSNTSKVGNLLSDVNLLSIPMNESTELLDYLMVAKACMEISKIELMPRDISRSTAILKRNSILISNPRPEEFKLAVDSYRHLEWEGEDYLFKVPADESDLFNEGNQLSHCVGGYRDKIINGCQVIFMRKASAPNEPFVTIEMENKSVVQIKQKFDAEVTSPEVMDWVSRWTGVIKRRKVVK